MRLWSTVVSHDATLPRRQSARYGRVALDVDRHYFAPAFAYCFVQAISASICAPVQFLPTAGICAVPVAKQRLDPLPVAEQRVAAERGPDVRVIEPVALLADAGPLLLAERRPACVGARACWMNASYCARGTTSTVAVHQRVLDPAELGAAGDVACPAAP